MISLDSLRTPLFLAATSGGKNKLSSPFAKNFNRDEWKVTAAKHAENQRDKELAYSALFLGAQVSSLRENVLAGLLNSLSKRTAILLAVASANRNTLLVQEAFRRNLSKPKDSQAFHIMELGEMGIDSAPQPELTSDDQINAIVDTMPNWFFEAKSLTNDREPRNTNYKEIEYQAGFALSVEAGLGDLWQAALWEGWHITGAGGNFTFEPFDKESSYYWFASQKRTEAAQLGELVRNRKLGSPIVAFPHLRSPLEFRKTKKGVSIRYGKPKKADANELENSINLLKTSYLSSWADHPLSVNGTNVTITQLIQSLWVIDQLSQTMLNKLSFRRITSYKNISDLSLRIRVDCLKEALMACLGVDKITASALVTHLSIDPQDTGKCFNEGLWLHPLVKLDDNELLIVKPSVKYGSTIRFAEKTLQTLLGSDLSKTTDPGIAFENELRVATNKKLNENPIIKDFICLQHAIRRKREDEEEIDMLLRIGKVVIVVEAKCFLAPSEPIERFNHLKRLEDAAVQAERKAKWVQKNISKFASLLTYDQPQDLEVIPLVILNQRVGSGLFINGVQITDIFFWNLFVSHGFYNSGAALAKDSHVLETTTMYRSEKEAETRIKDIFGSPPTMSRFWKAEDWIEFEFPLGKGVLKIAKASMKENSLVSPQLAEASYQLSVHNG